MRFKLFVELDGVPQPIYFIGTAEADWSLLKKTALAMVQRRLPRQLTGLRGRTLTWTEVSAENITRPDGWYDIATGAI